MLENPKIVKLTQELCECLVLEVEMDHCTQEEALHYLSAALIYLNSKL